jgi:hypothetical protein
MVNGPGEMSGGVSTQAVLVKLLNISAVACVAQAPGETPSDDVSVTSGCTSARCGKDTACLVSCQGC